MVGGAGASVAVVPVAVVVASTRIVVIVAVAGIIAFTVAIGIGTVAVARLVILVTVDLTIAVAFAIVLTAAVVAAIFVTGLVGEDAVVDIVAATIVRFVAVVDVLVIFGAAGYRFNGTCRGARCNCLWSRCHWSPLMDAPLQSDVIEHLNVLRFELILSEG